MKPIKCELGLESLLRASENIDKYADTWEKRNENLAKRLMWEVEHEVYLNLQGIVYNPNAKMVIRSEIGKQAVDTVTTPEVNFPLPTDSGSGLNVTWTISIEGKDVAFIEFGAGVYHNGSGTHPRARYTGMKIGTFGQGKGSQNAWGYYDENGNVIITHGTPAQMPLYNALRAVIPKVSSLVKEALEQGVEP